jgi:translocation and assembly module TamA
MVYSAGVVNETTDSSESTIRTIGASLNRSRESWRESISINYQQEDYIVADDEGYSTLLIPSVNWSRTWGNNFIYTIDGLHFDIGLRGANKNLISDTDFYQLQGGIKAISSVNHNNRLIARGSLGSTWTEEFNQLPSSVRYFAGGAQSVRGYAYQSLGPVDTTGQVIGGKHLMVGSIEFEHSFNSHWGTALFYDGGNAIDSFADKLERGGGFGLRWKSPVGPVRIDLASALSRDGRPWRLHINIRPDL